MGFPALPILVAQVMIFAHPSGTSDDLIPCSMGFPALPKAVYTRAQHCRCSCNTGPKLRQYPVIGATW